MGALVRRLGTVIMLDYAIYSGSMYLTYRHDILRICTDVNCLEPALTYDIMCYIVRTQTG